MTLSEVLFYEMLRIRCIEEGIADQYSQQQMRCPVHLSIGQEAVAVGVAQALQPSDYVVSNHRAHAHYLAKGGSLPAMLAELYGKEGGCCQGRGGSMHLVDLACGFLGSTPIVGGSIPVGVGAAFGSVMQQEERITAIFFGEGATEEGVFAESLNFAALKKLPVLFVCENNLYSVYSPLHVRQPPKRSRLDIASAHGIYVDHAWGNDIEAVYGCAKEAVERIRQGGGPVFIEFDTYRYREHCGPNKDNDIGYRTPEEAASWEKKCPIRLYENRFPQLLLAQMREKIEKEIAEAFAFAQNSPFPNETIQEQSLYAEHCSQVAASKY